MSSLFLSNYTLEFNDTFKESIIYKRRAYHNHFNFCIGNSYYFLAYGELILLHIIYWIAPFLCPCYTLVPTISCLKPFPHTTILQQTTLNIFCQKIENIYNWMNNLWLKVENIVAKEEIDGFVQFRKICFRKAVCCRGVRNGLYEGKC